MVAALDRIGRRELYEYIHDYCAYLSTARQLSEHTVRNYISDLVPFIEYLDSQGIKSPSLSKSPISPIYPFKVLIITT